MIHLMFIGPPGAGKGTQSKVLEKKLNAAQIATGDILRRAIQENTPLGQQAKEFMSAGKLVPDELMIALIRETFTTPGFSENWIMDGFPRTVAQAEAFDNLLAELSLKLDLVIEVDVERDSLIRRITGRRVCRKCQAPYHVDFNPPKSEGVCDYCGGNDIYQRDDDKEEIVVNRLKVYDDQTAPLINYYQSKDMLHKMDGNAPVEEVTSTIMGLVENLKK